MENPNPVAPKAPSIAAAIALIVMGLVVLVPSGLCTGVMVVGSIWSVVTSPGASADSLSGLMIPLVIGGPFVIGGGVMLWHGFKGIAAAFRKSGG